MKIVKWSESLVSHGPNVVVKGVKAVQTFFVMPLGPFHNCIALDERQKDLTVI